MTKRFFAVVALLSCSVSLLSGCMKATTGSSSSNKTSSYVRDTGPVTKPEKITMMVDGTLIDTEHGRDLFEERWEALTGIELEIIQPGHDVYYDEVAKAFESGDLPDVVLLSSTYYTKYAAQDMLADISPYYEGSELQAAIREQGKESLIDGIRIQNKLFGITPTRGNGCMTYIKKAWLDRCNLSAPANYEEYLNMLKAFTEGDPDGDGINGNTYGVSAAGIINAEAPYVNYLPEFFQDAYPSFYKNADGTWVDGFTEDSMKEAISRIKSAYEAGYIDPEITSNGTGNCRDKFYANNYGAFTYWAGTWAHTLSTKSVDAGIDGEIVSLPPIAEVGNYMERVAPVWCITSTCKNPAGVYQYFIETMLDRGDVETLWTYVPDDEKYGKNHIDRMLAIVPIENDPGAANAAEDAIAAAKTFNEHSQLVDLPYSTKAFALYNDELMKQKIDLVNRIVTEGLSIEDAYNEFESSGGAYKSQAVVDSLNAE